MSEELRKTIMDAMRSVSERADEFKVGCATFDGEWPDAEDKAIYDAEVALVERLRVALAALSDAAQAPEPDCWAILTPNGSRLVSPEEAKGRRDAYPLYAAPVAPQAAGDAAQAPEPTRYFVYDQEGGYNEFKTDAEREKGHQAAIDAYLDTGCDGWSEEVTQVVSGIVTHKTVKTNEEHKPAPCAQHPEHDDENCDDCAAWNEWPNHDFETCCQYEPALIVAPAAPAAAAPSVLGYVPTDGPIAEWQVALQNALVREYDRCAEIHRASGVWDSYYMKIIGDHIAQFPMLHATPAAAQPDERAAFEAWYGNGRPDGEGLEQSSYDDCFAAWQARATAPQTALTDEQVNTIMEQAQVFASAWSLVGGKFDSGNAIETAEREKANLRALLAAHTPQAEK